MKGLETRLDYPLATVEQLQELAYRIRYRTLRMIDRARSSHIGAGFSIAELLAMLYGKVLRIHPLHPDWSGRDRFVLSKGHGAAALYAVLAERGFFPVEWLDRFCQDASPLVGHVTHSSVPGVEASTGSLGHGLSIACGMALAAKRDGNLHRVFALLSDGECDEGSTWEAILFAGHHNLDNLIAIVDYNKIQSLGRVKEVLDLEPLGAKWMAFRWAVREIDGHDFSDMETALTSLPIETGRPCCIIAHTLKGKGVSFMEDNLLWHYRAPNAEEYRRAVTELAASR